MDQGDMSFNELPIENKFNIILSHNRALITRNDLLTEYIASLEYKLNVKESKPVPVVREIVITKVEKVMTPDLIGETLDLTMKLNAARVRYDEVYRENQSLKKALKHIR